MRTVSKWLRKVWNYGLSLVLASGSNPTKFSDVIEQKTRAGSSRKRHGLNQGTL